MISSACQGTHSVYPDGQDVWDERVKKELKHKFEYEYNGKTTMRKGVEGDRDDHAVPCSLTNEGNPYSILWKPPSSGTYTFTADADFPLSLALRAKGTQKQAGKHKLCTPCASCGLVLKVSKNKQYGIIVSSKHCRQASSHLACCTQLEPLSLVYVHCTCAVPPSVSVYVISW